MATRAQITVNGGTGSNDDVPLDVWVQLNNNGLGDEVTYEWTIISQPSGTPNAVLSAPTIQAPAFVPNKEGSYLIELIVNKDLPDQKIDRVIVAVRELETRNRIPAAGETTENNAETGWANTAVDQILQRVTRFTDAGVYVGVAGQAGLLPLDVVYACDITTIATGLPGQRDVPLWAKASAASQPTVAGLLGVLLGGVDESPAPPAGSLVRVAVLELVKAVDLGTPGVAVGTPVYITDAGTISLTPGTITRQVGTVLDDMDGGLYGIWFTGEGTFGTIQGVAANAPLSVIPGTVPTVELTTTSDLILDGSALALSNSGVVAGTYGDPAPAYPAEPASIVSSIMVDDKGRIYTASQAGITIGGLGAKTYVDNGDAATLASANAYTDARSYGLSSKVPVHVATTTALPANTANGSFQTLTANVHGPLGTIDGHTLLVGERILVKNEATTQNNGIYVLTQAGSSSGPSQPWIMTRADDANTAAELCGSLVTVNVGTVNAGTAWLFAYNPSLFVFGTTPVVWAQLNAVAATPSVLGTVQLAGALGGAGTLATAPVVALGTGYVSGVLPAANGGTGLSSPGASGNVLVSDGTNWTSAGVPAAQAAVTGGVQLAAGLGGSGSTALLPKLDMDHVTSGTLAVAHGGTGLTSSGVDARALLVSTGVGGFALQSAYEADSILGPYIVAPTYLQGQDLGSIQRLNINKRTGTTPTQFYLNVPDIIFAGLKHQVTAAASVPTLSIAASTGAASEPGGNLLVQGGKSQLLSGGDAAGGGVYVSGGDLVGVGTAPLVSISGGRSTTTGGTGGAVYVAGGTGGVLTSLGNGGAVYVSGGEGQGNYVGGTVYIEGGTANDSSGATAGDVRIYGGLGFTTDGNVYISRRPGRTTGKVQIDDAYINGTGTVGQVFVSRGASQPPEWQDLGGAPGPAANGAYTRVTSNYNVDPDTDFCVSILNTSTATLPNAALVSAGRMFIFKNESGATTQTVDPYGTQRIDNSSASVSLAPLEVLRIMRTSGAAGGGITEWISI